MVYALLFLSAPVLVMLALWIWTVLSERKTANLLARMWEEEARTEQALRLDYERALGLPVHDRAAVADELWARAADDDELAAAVLCVQVERSSDALGGMPSRQRLPFASGRAS